MMFTSPEDSTVIFDDPTSLKDIRDLVCQLRASNIPSNENGVYEVCLNEKGRGALFQDAEFPRLNQNPPDAYKGLSMGYILGCVFIRSEDLERQDLLYCRRVTCAELKKDYPAPSEHVQALELLLRAMRAEFYQTRTSTSATEKDSELLRTMRDTILGMQGMLFDLKGIESAKS